MNRSAVTTKQRNGGAAENHVGLSLAEARARFGFVIRSHRIGTLNLRLAQVDRVDEMVKEIYPDALCAHGDAPVWMISWAAAFGLAEYLFHNLRAAGMRALELGCGTAAAGIALERAGARVVCTDYDPLALAMADHNARLNGCRALETRLLDWYQPIPDKRFDLVVGSEVVYFEKSYRPLLSVLKRTVAPGGRAVLSDPWRPQVNAFMKMCLNEGFSLEEFTQMVHLPDRSQSVRITILTR